MQGKLLAISLLCLTQITFASTTKDSPAQNYITNTNKVLSTKNLKNPKATRNIILNVNLNALNVTPTAAFSITDALTYNFESDIVIYDSLGAMHVLSVFFVKANVNQWNIYAAVDGILTTPTPGSASFDCNGELVLISGMNSLLYNPDTGAASPQDFSVNFEGSTQFANENTLRSVFQDGYPSSLS